LEVFKMKEKCIDMIQYGYIALQQFPKSEKFTLAADIKRYMYSLLENIVKLANLRDKKRILKNIDICLEMLKTFIRLARDLKFLSIKKYEIISRHIVELGKMNGGYWKSLKG